MSRLAGASCSLDVETSEAVLLERHLRSACFFFSLAASLMSLFSSAFAMPVSNAFAAMPRRERKGKVKMCLTGTLIWSFILSVLKLSSIWDITDLCTAVDRPVLFVGSFSIGLVANAPSRFHSSNAVPSKFIAPYGSSGCLNALTSACVCSTFNSKRGVKVSFTRANHAKHCVRSRALIPAGKCFNPLSKSSNVGTT